MATLTITLAPAAGETGPDISQPIPGLSYEEAVQNANQLRKLLTAWRSPVFSVRAADGAEICRIDVRRLRAVHLNADLSEPAQLTPACGKTAAANDHQESP